MDIFTASLWGITGAAFIASLVKDKQKTFNSIKMARGMMKNMIGEIVGILFLIGLILTFIPPEVIKNVLGESNLFISTVISALVGSITLIPAFVAFPLVGSFCRCRCKYCPCRCILNYFNDGWNSDIPIRKQEFGLKFATTRNVLSFVFALIIALTMGVIM